ncbi:hypothetical protein SAMN05880561_1165 [Rhizobium sp. RU33A]|uniref:hypothetical protein n=1 Tax=Rhizobium sp. RU33A TaxID=1907413 RepID=UPI00095581C4|nr:hypothetical protein [Rhizobium sp. RU33A]SIR15874.1 hypothetical protein SAMN05880561_1165 [Rhizobium sp. RU33A]
MKIIDLDDPLKRVLEVYAMYWVDGMRSHLVIPYEDYHGLLIVRENKCEIVDPSINGFIIKKNDANRDLLIHWAAEKDGLIYKLIDPPDAEAVAELHRRIREDKPPF